jgi:hypothetical protein
MEEFTESVGRLQEKISLVLQLYHGVNVWHTQHRQEYKTFMKGTNKHYSLLHKVMDGNDFEMILLEAYPCNSKEELHARTRYWEARIRKEEEEQEQKQ